MRSIKARFKKEKNKIGGENYGAYIHLTNSVIYQNFSRKNLIKNFKKLMPKDEYSKSEIKGLIYHLEKLTNMSEEVKKRAKNNH